MLKKTRKALIRDYKIEYEKTPRGVKKKIVYTGDYYTLVAEKKILVFLKMFFAVALLSVAVSAGLTFIDTLSSYKVYVVLPQFAVCIPAIASFYYAIPLFQKQRDLTLIKKVYVTANLKQSLTACVVLSAIAAVCRIVFMIIETSRYNILTELSLTLLSCVSAVLLLSAAIYQNKINAVKREIEISK